MNTTSHSLFPHVLVRLGGSSYNVLEALKQSDLEQTLSGLIRLEQKRARQKEALCDELLEFIRTLDDTQAQNQVQNVRRDLYNGRKIKAGKLRKALQWMPEELQDAVQRYLKGEEKGKQLRQQAYQQYEEQVPRMRTQLQALSQEEALRKGLVLSSQGFLKKLPSYREASPGALAKKQLRTEQSLLKYLTRIKAKNSPFSTFNNLSLGTIVPTAAPIQVSSDSQSRVVGHTRLNNQLFRYLKGLITSYPAIYKHLLLRANPTITNTEEQYLYLTNHYNIEAFQRLPQQPVVKLILELCKAEPAGIAFQDLVNEITDYVEADSEAIEQYVRKLTDFGFLEFDFTVSGIDPNWDEQLVRVLKDLREKDVPHTGDLIHTLQDIRAWAELYSEADVDERQKLLTQSYDAFRAVCMRLHEAAGLPEEERLTYEERLARYRQMQQEQKQPEGSEAVAVESPPAPPEKVAFQHHKATFFYFKPEQMFYEDTTRQVAITLGNKPLQQWVEKVEKLLQALPLFRGHDGERATMKHYFLEHYASDAVVPLLQFYEHYYRDVKKIEAEQKAKKQSATSANSADTNDSESSEKASETISVPELEEKRIQVQQWNQALAEQLKTRSNISSDLVNITYEDIEGVNTSLALEPSPAESNSYGGFVQFYQEEDAEQGPVLKGVINALFPGYGRMMSRFLHILPYQVTEDTRDWNQQLEDKSSLLIEDCDASYFNANLHPPLLPQEVRMPGGHNSLPASQQIPITDFVVRYSAEEDNLQLVHQPSGKRAYVMDLGFQGSQGRSPLFQLLEKFTKAEYRYTNPIQQVVNQLSSQATEEENTIRVYPRINYEDQITLQRKTWVVLYEQIPRREPQESDAAYYYRINLWRKKQQMPEDIFITLNPNRGDTTTEQKKTKLSRDDYKPQYISFANPLLVGLLEKLLLKEPNAVVITEMLPSGDDMLTIDQQKYVSEYVVQWYT